MRLHTQIKGSGFPILCLHGHPGSGEAMGVFTAPLTASNVRPAQFKTYAPDLRGYGRSRTPYPFEMTRHLDDLEELLAQHKIEKCLVLGWSLGGILAMELALRRPDVVQGLVLVGTAARPAGSHPPITWQDNLLTGIAGVLNWLFFAVHPSWVPAKKTAAQLAENSADKLGNRPADRSAEKSAEKLSEKSGWDPAWETLQAIGQKSLFRYLICQHTPLAYQYLAQQGAPAFLRTSRYAEAALFQAIRAGYNRIPDVKTLQIPALVLCGECDRHITAESSLETARALINAQARCYPNTAHLFPWEIPDQMNADIEQWLADHADIWQLEQQL
jgi:pimeloyl-ACP methyl ester carboxylesterase